jgi:hypothetical protein
MHFIQYSVTKKLIKQFSFIEMVNKCIGRQIIEEPMDRSDRNLELDESKVFF